VIVATLLAPLLAANLEFGGDLGWGRLLGSVDAAPGRSARALDAVRWPWSMDVRAAYEWRSGHLVGLRYANWTAGGEVSGASDLGTSLHETLTLQTFGFEYVHRSRLDAIWWRLGGGAGFAIARDALAFDDGTIEAKGDGLAFWFRSGLELPVGRDVSLNLGAAALWASIGSMKAAGLESYAMNYDIARLDAGITLRI